MLDPRPFSTRYLQRLRFLSQPCSHTALQEVVAHLIVCSLYKPWLTTAAMEAATGGAAVASSPINVACSSMDFAALALIESLDSRKFSAASHLAAQEGAEANFKLRTSSPATTAWTRRLVILHRRKRLQVRLSSLGKCFSELHHQLYLVAAGAAEISATCETASDQLEQTLKQRQPILHALQLLRDRQLLLQERQSLCGLLYERLRLASPVLRAINPDAEAAANQDDNTVNKEGPSLSEQFFGALEELQRICDHAARMQRATAPPRACKADEATGHAAEICGDSSDVYGSSMRRRALAEDVLQQAAELKELAYERLYLWLQQECRMASNAEAAAAAFQSTVGESPAVVGIRDAVERGYSQINYAFLRVQEKQLDHHKHSQTHASSNESMPSDTAAAIRVGDFFHAVAAAGVAASVRAAPRGFLLLQSSSAPDAATAELAEIPGAQEEPLAGRESKKDAKRTYGGGENLFRLQHGKTPASSQVAFFPRACPEGQPPSLLLRACLALKERPVYMRHCLQQLVQLRRKMVVKDLYRLLSESSSEVFCEWWVGSSSSSTSAQPAAARNVKRIRTVHGAGSSAATAGAGCFASNNAKRLIYLKRADPLRFLQGLLRCVTVVAVRERAVMKGLRHLLWPSTGRSVAGEATQTTAEAKGWAAAGDLTNASGGEQATPHVGERTRRATRGTEESDMTGGLLATVTHQKEVAVACVFADDNCTGSRLAITPLEDPSARPALSVTTAGGGAGNEDSKVKSLSSPAVIDATDIDPPLLRPHRKSSFPGAAEAVDLNISFRVADEEVVPPRSVAPECSWRFLTPCVGTTLSPTATHATGEKTQRGSGDETLRSADVLEWVLSGVARLFHEEVEQVFFAVQKEGGGGQGVGEQRPQQRLAATLAALALAYTLDRYAVVLRRILFFDSDGTPACKSEQQHGSGRGGLSEAPLETGQWERPRLSVATETQQSCEPAFPHSLFPLCKDKSNAGLCSKGERGMLPSLISCCELYADKAELLFLTLWEQQVICAVSSSPQRSADSFSSCACSSKPPTRAKDRRDTESLFRTAAVAIFGLHDIKRRGEKLLTSMPAGADGVAEESLFADVTACIQQALQILHAPLDGGPEEQVAVATVAWLSGAAYPREGTFAEEDAIRERSRIKESAASRFHVNASTIGVLHARGEGTAAGEAATTLQRLEREVPLCFFEPAMVECRRFPGRRSKITGMHTTDRLRPLPDHASEELDGWVESAVAPLLNFCRHESRRIHDAGDAAVFLINAYDCMEAPMRRFAVCRVYCQLLKELTDYQIKLLIQLETKALLARLGLQEILDAIYREVQQQTPQQNGAAKKEKSSNEGAIDRRRAAVTEALEGDRPPVGKYMKAGAQETERASDDAKVIEILDSTAYCLQEAVLSEVFKKFSAVVCDPRGIELRYVRRLAQAKHRQEAARGVMKDLTAAYSKAYMSTKHLNVAVHTPGEVALLLTIQS